MRSLIVLSDDYSAFLLFDSHLQGFIQRRCMVSHFREDSLPYDDRRVDYGHRTLTPLVHCHPHYPSSRLAHDQNRVLPGPFRDSVGARTSVPRLLVAQTW